MLRSASSAALEILRGHYGDAEARIWLQRWRIFFMACSELWGYAGGQEWWVGHYRFKPRARALSYMAEQDAVALR